MLYGQPFEVRHHVSVQVDNRRDFSKWLWGSCPFFVSIDGAEPSIY